MDSGAVDVPQMMRSTDPPSTPACWRAFFDASTASVAAFSPSATKWRALIPVRAEIHSSVVSSTPSRSLLVTILPPRALPTPTILPAAPPFKPTCPQTDRRLCAESACCRSSVRPAPMYEMPRSAFSTPVACEFPCPITTEPLTPSRKEPPYFSGSTVSLTPISLGRRIPAASLLTNVARHRRADHAEDLPRHPLGRLEDDVARKAVRYEHVSHPASDVSTLHVPDETDARLVHETVRFLGEVVALPRLLADVDESDPRLPVQPEVTFCEHTAKNSEIQEVLRPAGDGGPGVE